MDACGDKKPSECIMIGDDLYLDIARAKEEKLSTIFVNSRGIEVDYKIGTVVSTVGQISKKMICEIEEQDFER